ncbi:hypothetical protein [Microcoleus sp. AR_TQ3_B6]|uniref:hypothetical protein n=1 Tax=Microcoleus sp. AR_TQ3_B6 TaxID=3055284 RepID=UPI002FD0B921
MGSLRGDKGRKSPEMLCKTPIVFDDEYSAMNIPNRATANETPRPNYNGTPFSLGISPALDARSLKEVADRSGVS